MALTNIQADVDGPNTGWSYAGSTDIAVVMGTDDDSDETDRINAASGSGDTPRHDWYVDALAAAETIDQVDTTLYVRSSASETIRAFADDGSTLLTIRNADPVGSSGNYTHWDDSDIDHPTAGPGGWDPTDFPGGGAGIIFGVLSSSDFGGSVFCTYFNAAVTFTPIAGGFAHHVASILPPLIAAASHGLLSKEIQQFFSLMKTQPTTREEFETVKRMLLCRPRFAF